MARPVKCRRVCFLPGNLEFHPANHDGSLDPILMTMDEFEAIRLIDKEGLSQEACSARMEVGRTTVQQIYTAARRKLADALVDGLPLKIGGGEYRLCSGDRRCSCTFCQKRRALCDHETNEADNTKEEHSMKLAIPLDENKADVCVSFARAPFFLFHDTQTNTDEIKVNPAAEAMGGAGVKAAQFVLDEKADTVLTVRCGENAAKVFQAANISIYKTAGPTVAENLAAFKEEKLAPLTHFHAGFHGIQ